MTPVTKANKNKSKVRIVCKTGCTLNSRSSVEFGCVKCCVPWKHSVIEVNYKQVLMFSLESDYDVKTLETSAKEVHHISVLHLAWINIFIL